MFFALNLNNIPDSFETVALGLSCAALLTVPALPLKTALSDTENGSAYHDVISLTRENLDELGCVPAEKGSTFSSDTLVYTGTYGGWLFRLHEDPLQCSVPWTAAWL